MQETSHALSAGLICKKHAASLLCANAMFDSVAAATPNAPPTHARYLLLKAVCSAHSCRLAQLPLCSQSADWLNCYFSVALSLRAVSHTSCAMRTASLLRGQTISNSMAMAASPYCGLYRDTQKCGVFATMRWTLPARWIVKKHLPAVLLRCSQCHCNHK